MNGVKDGRCWRCDKCGKQKGSNNDPIPAGWWGLSQAHEFPDGGHKNLGRGIFCSLPCLTRYVKTITLEPETIKPPKPKFPDLSKVRRVRIDEGDAPTGIPSTDEER